MSENSPEGQPEFIQQLLAKYHARREAGEDLTQEQFLQEHSEYSTLLRAEFAILNSNSDIGETVVHSPDKDDDSTSLQTVVHGTNDSETSIPGQSVSQSGSHSDLTSLQSFGRYEIKKVLGQGAMGSVYLARDVQLDRDVALKIPKFDGTDVNREELLERFYREARAAATLRSPNICPVYDVGEINGQHYITMAYIEGRPLKDFTKSSKRHSEKQVAVTIRKLALGLAEAHEIGVIHRDLKPANIMMDKKSEPVVMDFGLARRSSSDDVQMTQSGVILGTPAYMAPEQVEGDPEKIGPHTDIYALGVIMYELITGQLPFRGNLMSILQQIALNNPAPPSEMREGLDPRLETICLKLMAGEIKDRYQSMEDVAADLQEYIKNPNKRPPKRRSDETIFSGADASRSQVSNPALITIEEPKSFAEQLREKSGKPSRSSRKRPDPTGKNTGAGSRNMLIAGGLGGIVLLLGIVFLVRIGKYDVQLTVDDPSIKLSVDDDAVRIDDGTGTIRLSAGKHELKLEKDGLTTEVDEFTVTKDGKTTLYVTVLDNKLAMRTKPVSRPPPTNEKKSEAPTQATPENLGLVLSRDEFVDLSPGSLHYDGSHPLTFECWMGLAGDYPTAVGDGAVKLFGCGAYLWSEIIPLVGSSGSPIPFLHAFASDGVEDGEKFARVPISAEDTDLIHFACVYSGNTYTVFLNGQRLTDPQPFSYKIGRAQHFGLYAQLLQSDVTRDYQVFFDEVRISKTARYNYDFEPQKRFEPDDDTLALYHFDESGNVLTDSSGNGHYAMIGSAQRVALDQWPLESSPNSGLRFAGEHDAVILSDLKEVVPPLTMEAWVTPEPASDGHVVWIGAPMWQTLEIWGGRWQFGAIRPDGSTHVVSSPNDFEPNKTVHVAVTWNGSQAYLYLDGEDVSTPLNLPGPAWEPHPAVIGNNGREMARAFGGVISQVRISNSIRYRHDFTPQAQFDPDDQTVALYNFREGQGGILKDATGHGFDGIIQGAKWVGKATSTTPSPAFKNHALSFDGENDYVVIDSLNLADYPPSSPLTLEMTVKLTNTRNCNMLSWLGKDWIAFYQSNGHWGVGQLDGETSRLNQVSAQVELDKAVQLAAVRENGQWILFIDGIKQEMQPQGFELQSTEGGLYLGGVPLDLLAGHEEGRWMAGAMDEVRVSTSARYHDNYQPAHFLSADDQTLALYHFDEGEGARLVDSSGNEHHGKIVGATWTADSSIDELASGRRFQSRDDIIEVEGLGLTPDEPFTMEAWCSVPPARGGDAESQVIAHLAPFQLKGFRDPAFSVLKWEFVARGFHNSESSGVTSFVIPETEVVGARHHVAGVWDGDMVKLYLDGVPAGQMSSWNPSANNHAETIQTLIDQEWTDSLCLGHESASVFARLPRPDNSLFAGELFSLRISKGMRYQQPFQPTEFQNDEQTVALYHFTPNQTDTFPDLSGHGHDGKLERTSKPGANAMLKFEPGDGVIFPGLIDDTESLTMECWLQIDHDTMRERAHAFILGTWQDYGILTDSSTGHIALRCREPDGPTNSYIRAPLDAATQKLAHFAVVRDAQKKEHRFYVDGKLLGRMQLGDVHKGQAFHLCGREYQWGQETGYGFAGLIDEVRISSVARYDADFEPQRRFETDADTRALYHFDTGQGELAKDATGNGFGGQISGAEWVSDTH